MNFVAVDLVGYVCSVKTFPQALGVVLWIAKAANGNIVAHWYTGNYFKHGDKAKREDSNGAECDDETVFRARFM